ncbi:MAG: ABC transporter permease [Pseudobutyrivibrio sp.]|nr:ABC transporter permease [Pseudobutyrivibrio sp.]MBP5594303.1 ABC transporter permease [Pseudobutyrivibrio sp.]MBQ7148484.1 ABC transporter permease [Pseudobutyrivibrio sp.]
MSRKAKRRLTEGLFNLYGFLVYGFLYIPVIVMVVFSFNDSTNNQIWNGFTTEWYGTLMSDSELWRILLTTVVIAIISTVIAVVLGTIGAVGMSRTDFKGKKLISTLLYIPIIIPEIVLAVATLLVIRKAGLGLGMLAMCMGNVTLILPYVYITVKSRLTGMDQSIEEASLDLGANRSYTFLHVILPNILPGVVSGAFMAFTLAFGDLVIVSFMANATTVTLPMDVYSMLKRGIRPEINALSTVILVAFLVGITASKLISSHIDKMNRRKGLEENERKEGEEDEGYEGRVIILE